MAKGAGRGGGGAGGRKKPAEKNQPAKKQNDGWAAFPKSGKKHKGKHK